MPDSLALPAWPAWLDDSDGLVERLRLAHLPIGVGDELRLRLLLGRMKIQGLPSSSADSVARWLGPILCRNADHHVALLRALRAIEADHLPRRLLAPDVAPQTEQESLIAAQVQRDRRQIRAWVGVALLLAVGISVWLMLTLSPATLPPPNATHGGITQQPAAAVGVGEVWWSYELGLIPMIVALTFIMIRRRRRSFLLRGLVPRDMPMTNIPLPAAAVGLFRPDRMRTPAADWRRHRWEEANIFDPVRSIERTVRAGGEPRIVNGRRRILPEYILLVDRAGAGDHVATIADHLTRRLKAEQVDVIRLDYRGDPRRLTPVGAPGGRQRQQTLEELQAKRQTHQLIVLADPASAFDRATRQPRAWLRPLAEWPRPIWMSPTPATQQGASERWLQRRGFEIVETSAEGAADVGRLMRRDDRLAPRAAAPDRESALDLTLAVDSYLWTGERSPSEAEIANLIHQLELELEPQAFALLAAIAVFPMTEPRLTLYAAAQLSRSERWTNVLETLVCQVSRLPWLRQGRLPEWLRAALVEWLERPGNGPLADTIRAMWLQLLEKEADDSATSRDGDSAPDTVRLEFVRSHAQTVGERRMQQVIDQDRKRYEERILLAFLTHTPVRQVVFEAPTNWRDLAPRRWTTLEAIVVGLGLVISAAMVVWSGPLKSLISTIYSANSPIVDGATLAAISLSYLVVLGSYLRQFPFWSRLLNGTGVAIYSATMAIPGIAVTGLLASRESFSFNDKALLVLFSPIFAYTILWLGSSSSLRFPTPSPVPPLFLRWPIACAVAVAIVAFTLSLAIMFVVQAVAFDNADWRISDSTHNPFIRILFGRAGILVIALVLICGLYVSLVRCADVSASKCVLVGSAFIHVLGVLGAVATFSLVGPASDSESGGAAMVVVLAATVCAPLAVTRWRSLDGSTLRFIYCLAAIALMLEIAKAIGVNFADMIADSPSMALVWFVPALLPAYLIARRLAGQPRLPVSNVLVLIVVAGGGLALGALAFWTVVNLVGSTLRDVALTMAPAVAIGLEAGSFLLGLRYGHFGWSQRGAANRFLGPEPRASELLVPLAKAAWPILVLAPACLGLAYLGFFASLSPNAPDPSHTPAGQTPTQQTPVQQPPVQQAPANQARPTQQAPVQQAPVEQAPANQRRVQPTQPSKK